MNLGFYAGVEYRNKIFFSACTHNGLYEMDLATNHVKLIAFFNKEEIVSNLHGMAFIYENYAWFIPKKGKHFIRVNLDSFEMKYYALPHQNMQNAAFVVGRRYSNSEICLIPRGINNVVCINMETNEIKILDAVINNKEEITSDGIIIGKDLYIFFSNKNIYAKVNLQSGKRVDYPLTENIRSVCFTGNQVWTLYEGINKISCHDLSNGKIVKEILLDKAKQYNGLVYAKDKIICLPFQAPGFLLIDTCTYDNKEERPSSMEFPAYLNKTVQVDSKSGHTFSIGHAGILAQLSMNKSIDYKSISIDTLELWHSISKYKSSREERLKCYDMMSIGYLECVVSFEEFLCIVNEIESKSDDYGDQCTGSHIWNYFREDM